MSAVYNKDNKTKSPVVVKALFCWVSLWFGSYQLNVFRKEKKPERTEKVKSGPSLGCPPDLLRIVQEVPLASSVLPIT